MSPTGLVMAEADTDRESVSAESGVESLSRVSVAQPSLTAAAVSLTTTWMPTQKESGSSKEGKDSHTLVTASEAPEHRDSAEEEQEAIEEFLESMPMIGEDFNIRCKIGEGAFSSVYLACLKDAPEERVAIKHLVPTSSAKRIENEIHCLQTMGGRDHIMSLLTCVRHKDHVALVMPYFKHNRFPDYLHTMSLVEARQYMRALLTALRAVHTHQFVHRDIKPSNFLYNRTIGQFQLVDFGLAHAVKTAEEPSKLSKPRALTSTKGEPSSTTTTKLNCIVAPPTYSRQLHLRGGVRVQRQLTSRGKATPLKTVSGRGVKGGGKHREGNEVRLCPVRHKIAEVCDICLARSKQVAPRAGTPGFRAPEVLLKSPIQTTAIDIWSAGVIFLCLLSGRYPFFRANNDLTALTQIVVLLGSQECTRAANKYGKDLVCVPEVEPTDLAQLCRTLRSSLSRSQDPSSNHGNTEHLSPPPKKSRLYNSATSLANDESQTAQKSDQNLSQNDKSMSQNSESTSWREIPDEAFDLLYQLLNFNPLSRITATQALEHSFLTNQT